MPPHGAQASLYVPRREEISERAEHAHGRVESLSEVERAHVASDESDLDPRGDRFLSRTNEHRRGPIHARHLVPASREREIVIARPAPEVQDRPRLPSETPEHPLQEIDVSLVVHDAIVDSIVIAGETAVRRV